MAFTIGVPKETEAQENRVALIPDVAGRIIKKGLDVIVEPGAGESAHFSDAAYEAHGARIADQKSVYHADVVVKVAPPDEREIALFERGGALISFMRPLDQPETIGKLAEQGVTVFSMEMVPRITRAQRLDALSAMSAIGGYKAVLLAANTLPKFFPLLTTAAGTIRPAKVFVLGAGVAGLLAIATARRLGAVVSGYDVRPAVREEVQSLGAKFIELELDTADAAAASGYAKALAEDKQQRQIELLIPHLASSDVVITTALIPGRPAPLLISEEAVKQMVDGSVIVDMAAPNGGNCALTETGKSVVKHGVLIHGVTNLPAEMPVHASQMYSRTIMAALDEFVKEGALNMDFEDDIVNGACVAHDGEVRNERIKGLLDS
jgi:NAD(P) transhydrogenase subunit alpha